jgi:hypothetical protein
MDPRKAGAHRTLEDCEREHLSHADRRNAEPLDKLCLTVKPVSCLHYHIFLSRLATCSTVYNFTQGASESCRSFRVIRAKKSYLAFLLCDIFLE